MVGVTSGPRGRLRFAAGAWRLDDVADERALDAFRAWMADPVLAESLNRVPEEVGREQAAAIARRHDGRSAWLLFIRTAAEGVPVGYVSFSVDPTNGVATMEFVIGEAAHRGLSVMDAVAAALGDWVFGVQRIRKVCFHVRADNRVTVRWLSSNAVLEGRLRGDMVLPDGRVVDRLIFGIMPSEWALIGRKAGTGRSAGAPSARREHSPGARIGLRANR